MSDEFNTSDVVKAGVRSAAASVPGLASSVQLWNEHEAVELQRRVQKYWLAFTKEAKFYDKRFAELNESVEYLHESIAILQRAFEHASREPAEEKQVLYAVATVNAWVAGPSMPRDRKLSIIDTLDSLTVTDIEILQKFADTHKFKIGKMPNTRTDDSLGELIASITKLESRGLIAQTSKPVVDTNAWGGDINHWSNQWRMRFYEILPFGKQFVELCTINSI